MGSHENLGSPSSPTERNQPHQPDWQPSTTRKSSLMSDSKSDTRRTSVQETSEAHQQSTSEMFKDLLSQKRNMILSKLTSFEHDVSMDFCSSI